MSLLDFSKFNFIAYLPIQVVSSGLDFSIASIYFSWYDNYHYNTTRIKSDQPGPLLSQPRSSMGSGMGERPFLTPFRWNIKNDTQ